MVMVKLINAVLIVSFGFVSAEEPVDLEKRQCRSTHFWWKSMQAINEDIELFYVEMKVQQSADGSYFMAAGFSGGYFGLQELYNSEDKIALFSVWEPGNPHDYKADQNEVEEKERVKILASGENVEVKRFGGEGTGGQSRIKFNWELDKTYRFIVTAKAGTKPEGTIFSGHIYNPESKKWQLMATFHTKLKAKKMKGLYSFIEDFRRNYKSAKKTRKASYGNAWARTVSGKWVPLTTTIFTADGNPSMAINAGKSDVLQNGFYMQTGGETKNELKLQSPLSYEEHGKTKAAPPADIANFPKP